VKTAIRRDVFSQIIAADTHQLHRIQSRTPQMRCRGGVGGSSGEFEIHARIGERLCVIHLCERSRMPADGYVDIVESASARHERLGRAAFFCWATVIAYTAFLAGLFQPV